MSFASTITDTVPLTDGSVVVRKLGWKPMQAARDEKQRQHIQVKKDLGPDFQGTARKLVEGSPDELKKQLEEFKKLSESDPFLTHDKGTLLEKGIVSWTYDTPVNAETIADLDEDAADTLARRIFELSRRKTEAERKN